MNTAFIKQYWNNKVLNDLTGREFSNSLAIYVLMFKLLKFERNDKIVVFTKSIESMSLLMFASYICKLKILILNEDNEKDTASRIIAFFPKAIFCERGLFNKLEEDLEKFNSIPSLQLILTTGVVLSDNVIFELHSTKDKSHLSIIKDVNGIVFINDINSFINNYSEILFSDTSSKLHVSYLSDSSVEFQKEIQYWADTAHKDFTDTTNIGSYYTNSVSLNMDIQKYPYILTKILMKNIRIDDSQSDVHIFDSEHFEALWKELVEPVKQVLWRKVLYYKYPCLYRKYVEKTFKQKLGEFKEIIIINPSFSKNILNILGKSKLPVSTLTILRNEYDPSFYNNKGVDIASNNGTALRNISSDKVYLEKLVFSKPSNFWQRIKKFFGLSCLQIPIIKNYVTGYETDRIGDNVFATSIEEKFKSSSLVKDATFAIINDTNHILIEPDYDEADLFAIDLHDYSELEEDYKLITDLVNESLPTNLKISAITIVGKDGLIKSNTGNTKKYLYRGTLKTKRTPVASYKQL